MHSRPGWLALLFAASAFTALSCDDERPALVDEESGAAAGSSTQAGKSGAGASTSSQGGAPDEDGGSGPRAGAMNAGSSSGGTAGSGTAGSGTAGSSAGGNGSAGTAGTSGQGGEGGEPDDLPLSDCGNGALDPGERCDDGNDIANDGCSAECTLEACDDCTDANFPPQHPLPLGDCAELTEPEVGPAVNQPRCQAVLDCIEDSGCAKAEKNIPGYEAGLPCFCGTLEHAACAALGTTDDLAGDCKNEILAASNPGSDATFQPAEVLAQFTTKGTPIGEAMLQVNDPGALPVIGCGALPAGADEEQCELVRDCLFETQCAVGSARDGAECYCGSTDSDTCFNLFDSNDAKLSGACKAEIQQASGGPSVPPLQIAQFFYDTTTPVGAAIQESLSLSLSCQSECFGGGAQ